jgi:hypothetical protein
MPSYVQIEAAGPYVDVTVMGPYRTVPLEPKAARTLAREIEQAADIVENPPPDPDLDTYSADEGSGG